MVFRQLFDRASSTYTYLLADRIGGEALIIDPVLDRIDLYLRLLRELRLHLELAIDTHLHADHVTALGRLAELTACDTAMGAQTRVSGVSVRMHDGDRLGVAGVELSAMYTPGHTRDSYSLALQDRVFTGDTLFIRSTGRTDFSCSDPRAQYDSIFHRLLELPDATLVYPGHDEKGETVSSIGEERRCNPRLNVRCVEDYVEMMNGLELEKPRLMDLAIPANLNMGICERST